MEPATITTRRLSADEREQLGRSVRMSADEWAWLLMPVLALGAIGRLVGWSLGANAILLLWGQWLYDPHVFPNSDWHAAPGSVETPFPFPAAHFRLHRLRESGRVLRVELLAPPVPPQRVLPSSSVELAGLRESEVLQGTLDDLSAAVSRAHERSPGAGMA